MQTLTNHADSGKQATVKDQSELCMIVGWRRITGRWDDIHQIVDRGCILIRESTGYRVMHSDGVAQGALS